MKVYVLYSEKCWHVTVITNINGWQRLKSLKKRKASSFLLHSHRKTSWKLSRMHMNYGAYRKVQHLKMVRGHKVQHQTEQGNLYSWITRHQWDKFRTQQYHQQLYTMISISIKNYNLR